MKLSVKALSVNECFQGRRFKTKRYLLYERLTLQQLSEMSIPTGKLSATYIFGVSNSNSDADNLVKPFQDILQKKYGFNDRMIYRTVIEKVLVKKGEEFIEFRLDPLE